jgi:hypothetical protein
LSSCIFTTLRNITSSVSAPASGAPHPSPAPKRHTADCCARRARVGDGGSGGTGRDGGGSDDGLDFDISPEASLTLSLPLGLGTGVVDLEEEPPCGGALSWRLTSCCRLATKLPAGMAFRLTTKLPPGLAKLPTFPGDDFLLS